MKKKLQIVTVFIFLFLHYNYSLAAKYYFSTSGDDSRTAAQAQNSATPWKSINKLNAIFKSLQPGDEVLFKRGDTFYGTIDITKSGANGRPIKISAYGTGSKPVITSLVTMSGWKSVGKGIYEAGNKALANESKIVLINGEVHEVGRYPNSDAKDGGYLNISSKSGNSVTSKELNASSNFSGGDVIIRKNQWIIDKHKISNHSGNRISYSGSSSYSASEGYGFFIQNHINTLDQVGEWYYNGSGKKVSVYFGSQSPNSYRVQVASLDYLVTKAYLVSHIVIDNLNFNGANKDAIHIAGGRGISIQNSDISHSGENGITSMSILDLVIDNNRINQSHNNGIFLRYGNEGAVVKNNIVENTFVFTGSAESGNSSGIGIYALADNTSIEYNEIRNTGYSGIYFGGNSTVVKNNLIDTYCISKNDGGGIYTYVGASNLTYKGRKVIGNIILNGVGSRDGIPRGAYTSKGQAQGIFLDDNSNGIEIIGNSISNAENSGLKIANSRNITFSENTVFNSWSQVLLGSSKNGADTRNIRITDNILFAKYSDQYTFTFRTDKNDVKEQGNFDQNYFARPLGDDYHIFVSYKDQNSIVERTFDLKKWQSFSGKDRNSSSKHEPMEVFKVVKMNGKNLFENKSLDKNIKGLFCNSCDASWSKEKLSNGSVKVQSPGASSVGMPVGSVKKGKDYILKFKATTNTDGALRILLRHSGSPWEVVSPSTTVELTKGDREYTVLLQPYGDIESVNVMFISDEKNWTYWMDDIELNEADVNITRPEDRFRFEYNATKSQKEIYLDGSYVDAKNKTYSGGVVLAPYSSLVLIKKSGGPTAKPEVSMDVNITSPNANQEVVEGSTLTIKAAASASNTKISKVEFFHGKTSLGSSTKSPYEYNWNKIAAGDYTVTAVVTDINNKKETSEPLSFRVKKKQVADKGDSGKNDNVSKPVGDIQPGDDLAKYINLGSASVVKYDGQDFAPLKSSENVSKAYNQSSKSESSKTELFQSVQFAQKLDYSFGVPNGTYTIQTYHHETYFGYDKIDATEGQRVFDIVVEGEVREKNLDLFVKNGNKETVMTFENITVTDGKLDLSLIASANNATISGVAIYPYEDASQVPSINLPKTSLLINVGSTEDAVHDGSKFIADYSTRYFKGSSNINENSSSSDSKLFQSHRFSPEVNYEIPVSKGTYTVVTYHNETYFGETISQDGPRRRVFDIYLEGELVRSNFDIYVDASNQPIALTFNNIQVNDGKLNLDLIASVNSASISGIAIIKESDYYKSNVGARLRTMVGTEQEEDTIQLEETSVFVEDANEIKVYPNPARDFATISISKEVGEFSVMIHDLNGQLLNHYDSAPLRSERGKYIIPVRHLQSGMYIVTLVGKKDIIKRIKLMVGS